jgi:hypothetical protein
MGESIKRLEAKVETMGEGRGSRVLIDERKSGLQAGAVDDLHVDSELTAVVIDDQDTDGATARLEGVLETRPEVGLLNDGQGLLDITSLRHGNNGTVLHVEDTVLLEDRTLHGLDNNAGGGVADAGALLMQLLGEQVNTKVAVLTSGSGGADADDLARTTLKHEDVAKADVVAGDSDSVGHESGGSLIAAGGAAGGAIGADGLADVDMLVAFRVKDPVSHLVQAFAERVIVAILVVVTHLGLLVLGSRGLLEDSGLDGVVADRALGVGTELLGGVDGLVNDSGGPGVGREGDRSVDGGVNDGRVGVEGLLGLEGGGVYSSANAGSLATEVRLGGSGNVDGSSRVRVLGLLVLGLNAVAVLTLDKVNGTVVGLVAAVDLNVGFGVGGTRPNSGRPVRECI